MVSYFDKKKQRVKKVSDAEPERGGVSSPVDKRLRLSGFLTPAVVLVPAADGVRMMYCIHVHCGD